MEHCLQRNSIGSTKGVWGKCTPYFISLSSYVRTYRKENSTCMYFTIVLPHGMYLVGHSDGGGNSTYTEETALRYSVSAYNKAERRYANSAAVALPLSLFRSLPLSYFLPSLSLPKPSIINPHRLRSSKKKKKKRSDHPALLAIQSHLVAA